MPEYPVMKKQIPAGKILNFQNDKSLYLVVKSDGVYYGEKGYLLKCICIQSENVGVFNEYDFDDRTFREYNNNNIVVESAKQHPLSMAKYTAMKADIQKRIEKSSLSESSFRLLLVAGQNNGLGEDMEAQAEAFLVSLLHLSDEYAFNVDDLLSKAKETYSENNK
jgi:hypothetical protein